ncbi:hypothetical protein LTR78_000980 [Recurvomyces mirabilis]|uniref:F-box domain-containing protein n=1 Tax=Recurvomyces mirabilis TaxID=574656 RepID=A0AAE1C615_9PEZI|nr:hypothetical protein LTR78_000980 [Recurvomyces mirabilis]KAK5158952.1 hypothetical protein LTS14_003060 [Recurvomyces mirabilis]
MAPRKRKADNDQQHIGRPKRHRSTGASTEVRHTREMTTNAPRKAVFDTVELLGNILSHLIVKTLFGVQRVCQQFRTVVQKSSHFQERMFLQIPSTQTPPVKLALVHYHLTSKSPNQRTAFYIPDGVDFPKDIGWLFTNPNHAILAAKLNPLLVSAFPPLDLLNRLQGGETRQLDIGRRPLREVASWQHTIVSDVDYGPTTYSSATVSIKWSIPGRKLISGRVTKTIHWWHRHTLGWMLQDVLQSHATFQYCYGKEFRERKGWVDAQIGRLEKQAGREAVLESMVISFKGVVELSEEEAAGIADWSPSALRQSV